MTARPGDIDLYSPDRFLPGVPHEDFARLREAAPVFRHPHPDGGHFWALTRHDDCMAVSRDYRSFSSERGFVMLDDLTPELLLAVRNQLLGMDPPRHSTTRKVMMPPLASRAMPAIEPDVRRITRELLLSARDAPECEFVETVAGMLPTAVICGLMGIPRAMWPDIRRWSDRQTASQDPDFVSDPAQTREAFEAMGAYGYALARERKGGTGTDLISSVVNGLAGDAVTAEGFASLFVQLTAAGNETTRTLIAGGLHQLILAPHLFGTLADDPASLTLAVEEMLRFCCPLNYFRRTATGDTELRGVRIAAGDRVVIYYCAANRDPRVFREPDRFDVRRHPNPHLSFGYGAHYCIGAFLATLETRVFFEEFLQLFRGAELAGPPQRIRSNLLNGFKRLPVRLLPR